MTRFGFLILATLAVHSPVPAGEAAAAGPGAEAATARSVEELMARVDPRDDAEWPAESFGALASERLGVLAEALRTGSPGRRELAGLFGRGVRIGVLRPRGTVRTEIGPGVGLARVSGADGDLPPARAVRDLVHPFADAASRRFKFKVLAVDLTGPAPRTLVRYEGAGEGPRGRVQHTGRWLVEWSAASADPVPRIVAVTVESLDELATDAPWFVDRAAAVLDASDPRIRALARGGEFWHGRLDGLGEPHLMGHQGLAIGDVDGDGLEDVYVAQGTGLPNLLLRQLDDGRFVDVAAAAGVDWLDDTKGVLFADTDNDGDQDLLFALGPAVVLAKNDGQGRFGRFASFRAPTPAAFYSLSAADYDLDGDLDVYATRYVRTQYGVSVPLPFHDANNGPTNHLLRNDGDDRFVDVTAEVGLDRNNTRFSLVGAWADYDDDGDPDLYVANDFGRNNLYRNDGGRFVDVAADAGVEDQAAGMGVSWADHDGDGDLDLYVTNMFSSAGQRVGGQSAFHAGSPDADRRAVRRHSLGNTLFENRGDGTFEDVSETAGVRMGRWGWGSKFVDLDNDGREDLVVPNGFLTGALEDDL